MRAIVNAKFVKTYGIQKILDPIIDDLKKLYDECQIEINGNDLRFSAKCYCVLVIHLLSIYGEALRNELVLHLKNAEVAFVTLMKCDKISTKMTLL